MLQTLIGNIMGMHFVLRCLHVFFGIIWIGLLYYFNFVQGAFMAETTEAVAKSQVLQKLLPRAMWWFRWGAMWTFVAGVCMLMIRAHLDVQGGGMGVFATPFWINILTGALFGTLMFLNVWLIIWPKQKTVIANAVAWLVAAPPTPMSAARRRPRRVASRTNTLFSIPMLFFMLATNHFGFAVNEVFTSGLVLDCCTSAIILGLEFNAIKGKTGPMTTIKGVIHLWLCFDWCFRRFVKRLNVRRLSERMSL